jgi:hypothetical protein
VIFPYEDFDLKHVKTHPLKTRRGKASVDAFAGLYQKGSGVKTFIDSLPDILAASDFKAVVQTLLDVRRAKRGILWGLGAHVIKTGLSSVLIDLMERGFVSAIATNGAGAIHDFEIAIVGTTSEKVDETLGVGQFGMAEETGRLLNSAINDGVAEGLGVGQAVGKFISELHPQYEHLSVTAAAHRLGIPLTVHIAVGTDVIHMHPSASGSALGEGSFKDFRYMVSNVSKLDRGVYLNCGSAVVLPEVFLKAVALIRNRGNSLERLTTVNLDFVRGYRPLTNVVVRPTAEGGHGYAITGHHELMIPLLAAALIDSES